MKIDCFICRIILYRNNYKIHKLLKVNLMMRVIYNNLYFIININVH